VYPKSILAYVLAMIGMGQPGRQDDFELETDIESIKKRALKRYEIEKNQPISKRKMKKRLGKKKRKNASK